MQTTGVPYPQEQPRVIVYQSTAEHVRVNYPKSATVQSVILGLIHLIFGLLFLLLCVYAMKMESIYCLALFYNGLWIGAGLIFIGCIGITAGAVGRKQVFALFMAFSILAILLSIAAMVFGVIAILCYYAVVSDDYRNEYGYYYTRFDEHEVSRQKTLFSMSATYLAAGFLEFIISIWSSVFGCSLLCMCCGCCCNTPQRTREIKMRTQTQNVYQNSPGYVETRGQYNPGFGGTPGYGQTGVHHQPGYGQTGVHYQPGYGQTGVHGQPGYGQTGSEKQPASERNGAQKSPGSIQTGPAINASNSDA